MSRLRRLLAALGAVLLAGCGAQGTYYEQTPAQAVAALKAAKLPIYILGDSAHGSKVTQPDSRTVVIAPTDAMGSELARFVATVVPEGAGSRVAVAVEPPEGRNKDRVGKAMQANAIASALLQRFAAEHVAAALEHRSFDMSLGNPVVNAIPGIKQQFAQANDAAMAAQGMQGSADDEKRARDGWGTPQGGAAASDWGEPQH